MVTATAAAILINLIRRDKAGKANNPAVQKPDSSKAFQMLTGWDELEVRADTDE